MIPEPGILSAKPAPVDGAGFADIIYGTQLLIMLISQEAEILQSRVIFSVDREPSMSVAQAH